MRPSRGRNRIVSQVGGKRVVVGRALHDARFARHGDRGDQSDRTDRTDRGVSGSETCESASRIVAGIVRSKSMSKSMSKRRAGLGTAAYSLVPPPVIYSSFGLSYQSQHPSLFRSMEGLTAILIIRPATCQTVNHLAFRLEVMTSSRRMAIFLP